VIVRIRLAAGLVVAGTLLAGCSGSATPTASGHDHSSVAPATVSGAKQKYAGVNLAEPYRRPTFTLTDTANKPYDFKALTGGRPTLLYFGYTRCPDVCPTTMADIAVALRGVPASLAKQVQVVFVTTDPAHDTPAVLAEYLHRFDADLPVSFVGLTGKQALIDSAQLSAGVPLAEDDGKTHSSLLLLYGKDDAAHVAFDQGNTPHDIASDLRLVAGAS
jgi:protein SCO1/2